MKQFLAMLAAVAIALIAYELYRKPQVEEAKARAEEARLQAQALKQEAAALAEQAEGARKIQAAALERQMAAQEEAMRQQTEAHAAVLKQQAEQTRLQNEALQQQAQELSRQASAMKEEVDSQRRYAEQERAHYTAAAYLAEGLTAAANTKPMIVEFYMQNGGWPDSNEDIGLPGPEAFTGRALKSVAVSGGGVVTLTYNEKTGVNGGTIQLVPELDEATGQVKWRCESTSYSEITVTIPQCLYRRPS